MPEIEKVTKSVGFEWALELEKNHHLKTLTISRNKTLSALR